MNTITRREAISSIILTSAGECSSCKRCERRCPSHVGIAERMEAAAKLFGL